MHGYETKGHDRTSDEFKTVMKAARHLNASRAAWAANRLTSGIDWCSSAKGEIVLSLLNGRSYGTPRPFAVAALTYAFETMPSAKGEMALTEQSRERAEREVTRTRAKLADYEKKAKAYRAKHGRPNYKYENTSPSLDRTVARFEDALAKLEVMADTETTIVNDDCTLCAPADEVGAVLRDETGLVACEGCRRERKAR